MSLEAKVARAVAAAVDEEERRALEDLRLRGGVALVEAFGPELAFGTAGIRGPLGVGPARVGPSTVARTTAAVLDALNQPGCLVLVGRDARHGSDRLAQVVARVATGRGHPVHLVDRAPTPVISWAIPRLGAGAGFVVTASHNPAQDNGLKVFRGDGAQIVAPFDLEVIRRRRELGPIELGPPVQSQGELVARHRSAVLALRSWKKAFGLRVAYSPFQGVGGPSFTALCDELGVQVLSLPAQSRPDPDFSAVPDPNPEKPGALEPLADFANAEGADLALAHDPDADRLAILAPDGRGRWRALSGNQAGVLMAQRVLSVHGQRPGAFVATTHVSTRAIEPLADSFGVDVVRTHTGFKWMARAARKLEPRPLLFAFEEAIGCAVLDLTRDKDGLAAGLLAMETHLAARGDLWGAWTRFCRDHGGFESRARTWSFTEAGGAAEAFKAWAAQSSGPAGFRRVNRIDHREGPLPARLIVDHFDDGSWAAVRPSGTEPKLKLYWEGVSEPGSDAWARAKDKADELGQALEALASG
ncbi:MAG: phospho-sugar mutase [Myxococcota bacterium]